MAWCCQATSHYLSQCWPRSLSPYGVTRPQCVKICGKVCVACVHMAVLHGLQWLHYNDCAMICWIWGTKDRDEAPSTSLLQKFGIEDIVVVLRWLRWYGRAQCATSCIKSVTEFPFCGAKKQGMPRKMSECVKIVSNCGLAGIDPQDWDAWRGDVWPRLNIKMSSQYKNVVYGFPC